MHGLVFTKVSDIGKDIIWKITNIEINNKPFILCDRVEKGIIFIKHKIER